MPILSDKEIEWESRKLGAMVGACAVFIASVVGGKTLGLSARVNTASCVVTGGLTGYMWYGFTRQAYQKKRYQLLEESSTKGTIPAFK
ncbi:hypothetical protein GGF46_001618 [Coemansia sp. RSA 552]|nr:hypothetical protein GGF46_001618 [Coemansia sp. RSA 552]